MQQKTFFEPKLGFLKVHVVSYRKRKFFRSNCRNKTLHIQSDNVILGVQCYNAFIRKSSLDRLSYVQRNYNQTFIINGTYVVVYSTANLSSNGVLTW